MDSALSRRIARAAAVAVVASTTCLGGAVFASPAFADEDHAFAIDIQDPDPVAPGASGLINYSLTNTSDKAINGVLINISVPPQVSVHTDSHCQDVGKNADGGQLISCAFNDELGKFAAGETKSSGTDFSIAADAPSSTTLGKFGALAVPLKDGKPTEDWNDFTGTERGKNVEWVDIKTASDSAGAWDQLQSMFGL